MPYYDYKCQICGEEFEKKLPIDDVDKPTTEPCPICGELKISVVIGAPGICDPVSLGVKRPDPEFQRLLGRMKEKFGPKSNIGKSGRFQIPREL